MTATEPFAVQLPLTSEYFEIVPAVLSATYRTVPPVVDAKKYASGPERSESPGSLVTVGVPEVGKAVPTVLTFKFPAVFEST